MADYRVYHTGATPDGLTWATSYTTVTNGLSGKTSSDTLWVAPSHAVTAGAGITWSLPSTLGLRILGVASNSADPATGLASPATAVEAVGAASSAFTIQGRGYIDSVKIRGGTNFSSGCYIYLGISTGVHELFFNRCAFELLSGATVGIQFGLSGSSGTGAVRIDVQNSTFKFGAAAQAIYLYAARVTMTNVSLDASGSTPTTLFLGPASDGGGSALIQDSDLSGRSFTNLCSAAWGCPYELTLERCKVPASISITTGTHSGPGGLHLRLHRVSNGDTEWGYAEVTNAGSLVEDTGITRSGGGAVSIAMDTTANVRFPYHPLILRWSIKAAAGSRTLTVHMVTDRATALTNADVALRAHHQDTTGATTGTVTSSEAADVFATPATLTSSSATWSGTSGFTNEQKREIALALTPAEDGYIKLELCIFTDLTNPLYVDAKVDLS